MVYSSGGNDLASPALSEQDWLLSVTLRFPENHGERRDVVSARAGGKQLEPPLDPVNFLSATPITATEAAWVRLKGAEAMRQAWQNDGVDVLDPNRRAAQPD